MAILEQIKQEEDRAELRVQDAAGRAREYVQERVSTTQQEAEDLKKSARNLSASMIAEAKLQAKNTYRQMVAEGAQADERQMAENRTRIPEAAEKLVELLDF